MTAEVREVAVGINSIDYWRYSESRNHESGEFFHLLMFSTHFSRADCGGEHFRRARCGSSARRDLCGGRRVTGVSTATMFVGWRNRVFCWNNIRYSINTMNSQNHGFTNNEKPGFFPFTNTRDLHTFSIDKFNYII